MGLKRFSTTALVASVVETETSEMRPVAPSGNAFNTARSAAPTPTDRSQCVVSALALAVTRRPPSSAIASVYVPPVSSPIQSSGESMRVS